MAAQQPRNDFVPNQAVTQVNCTDAEILPKKPAQPQSLADASTIPPSEIK
jgi:hypothetical protein